MNVTDLISVNFFTNGVENQFELLESTAESHMDVFGYMRSNVFHDPNPSGAKYHNNYCSITESLSDGYIKSIEAATTPYLFQVEHDWTFQNIEHEISQILLVMARHGLPYLRFNKRQNTPKVWDKKLEEIPGPVPFCLGGAISNNPHIIDVEYYRSNMMHRIKRLPGSRGIEENMRDLTGAIYGGLDHPATIVHLDGAKRW